MTIVKGGPQKVAAALVSASLALPVAGVRIVGNGTGPEWADLSHTDLPEHPWPASERNLTNEISSTARTFGPSAAISGSSATFSIKLPHQLG